MQIYAPSEQLKPYIRFYWVLEHDCDSRHHLVPHRIIPNGLSELMIHYGDLLYKTKDVKREEMPRIALSGQLTEYYDLCQTGKTAFVSVLFHPHALKLFFDIPQHELSDHNLDVALLMNRQDYTQLLETIALAADQKERIHLLDTWLIQRLHDRYLYNCLRIGKTIQGASRLGGMITVASLASEACLSEKQYVRVFRECLGVSPKKFLKIIRLQYACQQIQSRRVQSMTELAYACGYYDQAHLINDFKQMTGNTPKTYFQDQELVSDYYLQV